MIIDKVIKYIKDSDEFNKEEILSILNKAIHLKCQNIANYLLQENEKEQFDFSKDFPNVAPPWENFIIEWKMPKYIYSKEVGLTKAPEGSECTFFNLIMSSLDIPEEIKKFYDISPKWVLRSLVFVEINNNLLFMGVGCIFIDKEGKVIVKNEGKENSTLAFAAHNKRKEYLSFYIEARLVHLMATTFCHCKNVNKITNFVPDAMQKNRKRNNLIPVTKYYTLQIGDLTNNKSGTDKNLLKNSLHICRGHFKHYSEDAPLFGKYTGTVWCPMHTKGNDSIGVVKKDYQI